MIQHLCQLHCGRSGIVTAACAVALGGIVKVAFLQCHQRLYHLCIGGTVKHQIKKAAINLCSGRHGKWHAIQHFSQQKLWQQQSA